MSTHRPAPSGAHGGELPNPPELAVIGWPLDQTYSPDMQQAALAGAGLALRYGAIRLRPEKLRRFVARAGTSMRGINVTTPHKEAMASLCTRRDQLAEVAGAVNTVRFGAGGDISGYNTDGPGLLAALGHRSAFRARDSRATIIGAGGSACASAAALGQAGAAQVTVANRSPERAAGLCVHMRESFPDTRWIDADLRYLAPDPSGDLILSCVPPAAAPAVEHIVQTASPGSVFLDLSYGPGPTRLHSAARAAGLHPVPGLEMLLWQGVLAFEIFTGVVDPKTPDRMRGALVKAAGEWWLC